MTSFTLRIPSSFLPMTSPHDGGLSAYTFQIHFSGRYNCSCRREALASKTEQTAPLLKQSVCVCVYVCVNRSRNLVHERRRSRPIFDSVDFHAYGLDTCRGIGHSLANPMQRSYAALLWSGKQFGTLNCVPAGWAPCGIQDEEKLAP